MKVERSHVIASRLVEIAELHSAMIILEDLSWIPNSKWEQSLVSKNIEDRAARSQVKVVKTSAKNTSKKCSHCGGFVKASARKVICEGCRRSIDRDIGASRNVSVRLKYCFSSFSQLSVRTRVSKPVTPGDYPINVCDMQDLRVMQHC